MSVPPSRSRTSYAILGCGSVGHAVAEELAGDGKDVLILDIDERRVEALRDQDLDARVQDITEPGVAEAVAGRDIVLVLASDVGANRAAVARIREAGGDQYLVVRASDPVSEDELREAGADVVITPSAVIADSALRSVETGEMEYMARRLREVIDGTDGRMAILTHESPDPDSIASATALRSIAASFGVEADIIYEGDMGHRENRAFVNLLGIEPLRRSEAPDLSEYDTLALVETAHADDDESGNGSASATEDPADERVEGLSTAGDLDIHIDHVESDPPIEARFVDVRTDVSSTSTVLTKYLQEFDLSPSETVATALLYGIRAETLDFKRGTTPADLTAAAYLHPFADHDTLEQVESPSMSPETLDVLADAIQNRRVEGSHLFSSAGFVRDREALARAAQHLLDLEGITTTAVFGIVDERIHLSARSKDIRIDVGNVLDEAFGEIGEASGYSTQGAVEIPLGIFTGLETSDENRDTLLELTEEAVRRRLFASMGVESDGTNGG